MSFRDSKGKFLQTIQHNKEYSCISIIVLLMLFLTAFVYFRESVTDAYLNNETLTSYQEPFTLTVNGVESSIILPAQINDIEVGQTISLSQTLRREALSGDCLFFHSAQSKVAIYLDGELVSTNISTTENPLHLPYSSRWYVIRLPEHFQTGELLIEITYSEKNYTGILKEVYSGTKSAFIYNRLQTVSPSPLFDILILCFSLFLIGIGMVLKGKTMTPRLIFIGALSISIDIWLIMENHQLWQLFTGHNSTIIFILFSCYTLIPMFALAYTMTFPFVRHRKGMHVLFWISIFCELFLLLLQILGIASYIRTAPVIHLLIILYIVEVVRSYFAWRKVLIVPDDVRVFYRSIFILSAFGFMDMLLFYFGGNRSVFGFSKIGLLIFLCYHGLHAQNQVRMLRAREAKAELYKELAYTDLMTNIANRSAFEQALDRLRSNAGAICGYVLFADINNLKYINDNIGHAAGDDAIITTASLLKECFQDIGQVFRTGGDEFCVIVEKELLEESMKLHCDSFSAKMRLSDLEKQYPFEVAYAFLPLTPDINQCLIQVDQEMYQIKKNMKKPDR